ncbi:MAG TPA: hypothetical protein VFI62_13685, partial [Burkholderiales bacterium]|nr:hypothetical protein [Burkholderiales bacterium]
DWNVSCSILNFPWSALDAGDLDGAAAVYAEISASDAARMYALSESIRIACPEACVLVMCLDSMGRVIAFFDDSQ